MNTDELIVMGVLIVLAGALMAARRFVHTMEIPAPTTARPMATYNADSPLARDTEAPSDYQLIPRMEDIEEQDRRIGKLEEQLQFIGDTGPAASPAHIQQMATIKQRIFAQDRRIAELEQRHENMVQNYENLIATFKEREETTDNRLRDLEEHVSIMLTGFRD
tara:strand:- start:82 stop:570 length:489 start_codon:yes stop_codon:yes gene_type:complete